MNEIRYSRLVFRRSHCFHGLLHKVMSLLSVVDYILVVRSWCMSWSAVFILDLWGSMVDAPKSLGIIVDRIGGILCQSLLSFTAGIGLLCS